MYFINNFAILVAFNNTVLTHKTGNIRVVYNDRVISGCDKLMAHFIIERAVLQSRKAGFMANMVHRQLTARNLVAFCIKSIVL